MDQTVEEGARSDDDRLTVIDFMDACLHAFDPAVLHQDSIHEGLLYLQLGLVFDAMSHPQAVGLTVGLGPGGLHCWSLLGVQAPKLDGGGIGVLGHLPTQGIDLLDQLPFGQPPDGRVAGHEADGVDVDGEQEGVTSEPGCGQGRLTTRMPSAHDDYIVLFWVDNHF